MPSPSSVTNPLPVHLAASVAPSKTLPSILISDGCSFIITTSCTPSVTRNPPPALSSSNHWGVVEVLELCSGKEPKEPAPSSSATVDCAGAGEAVEQGKVVMVSRSKEKASPKSKKVSKREKRLTRRTKQLEVLQVEAKLAVGLGSFGW